MSSHRVPVDVDLPACLFGGQAFTWYPARSAGPIGGSAAQGTGGGTSGLEGVVRGTHVVLASDRTWTSDPTREPAFLARYLGAARTHPSALADDEHLAPLAAKLPGLRLLDQDPWEGLVQFMLSAVNNVPRIQENISRLSRTYGPPVGAAHAIPSAKALAAAGSDALRGLGLGFRAPRLHAAAEQVASGALDLDALADRPVEEARAALLALDGVGPKVAECVLCYGLGFDDAFPVDRWVTRASEALFGAVLTPEEARGRWGERAAMAQQLLFHGARMGLVEGVAASPVSRFDRWRSLRS